MAYLETTLDLLDLEDENVMDNLSELIKEMGVKKYDNLLEFTLSEITDENQHDEFVGGGDGNEITFPYNNFKITLDKILNIKEEEEKRKTILESLFEVREPEQPIVEESTGLGVMQWFKRESEKRESDKGESEKEKQGFMQWFQRESDKGESDKEKHGFMQWFQRKPEEEKQGFMQWFQKKPEEEKQGFMQWFQGKPDKGESDKEKQGFMQWFQKKPEEEKQGFLQWFKEEPLPVKEGPTPTKEGPTPTKEEPTPITEEPLQVKEEPTPTKEEPTPTTEEPLQVKEEPAPIKENDLVFPKDDNNIIKSKKIKIIIQQKLGIEIGIEKLN